jgi:circadian clock protein KaiC
MNKIATRSQTGVPGLDDVLGGGFPSERFYLVQGVPGSGKTTLALQFLLEGKKRGEKCLYITLSETKDELLEVAASHDWSLDGIHTLELSAVEQQIALDSQNTLFHPAEVELKETTRLLLGEIEKLKPSRVVFDSLSEIRLLAQSSLRYRRQLLAFKQFFSGRECTVLLLDDGTGEIGDNHIQSIVHGVIVLEQLPPAYGAERRRLQVLKMRGVHFRGGYHDFAIVKGGLIVFPRLMSNKNLRDFKRFELPSGIAAFDKLLDGGLTLGTSTLVLGPTGTGKSTLAMQFAVAAAKQGHKSIVFAFDEGLATLADRCDSIGMGLTPLIQEGKIAPHKVDASEMSPSQLAYQIRAAVETDPAVKLVVIDSMNGYLNAMASDKHLPLQLHELLSYLNQRGIATILTLAQHGMAGREMVTPADITYLADTVIVLRYFEAFGSVKRALSVMKKRSGNHESTIREYNITPKGILASRWRISKAS